MAGDLPTGVEATAPGWCCFNQQRGGRSQLAAQGQALQQAAKNHEDGGCDTDHLVARRDGHAQRAEGDQGRCQDHGRFAPGLVGKGADQHTAQWPREKTDAKGRCRCHQAAVLARHREKGFADIDCEIRIDDKVIELERITSHCGGD
ncbi:hypothetical protein D3C84_807850 [compost metagenome]